MNEAVNESKDLDGVNGETVATYLKQRPEFFNDFSDLLLELEIPHPSGDAVSIFDRQLASLREENRRLKANQQAMIDNARANEVLIKRIHGLVLQLMEAAGPRAIFETLNENLKQHFNADRVQALVFAEPSFAETDGLNEFTGATDSRVAIFDSFLSEGEARCGDLDETLKTALWSDIDDLRGSFALLPLMANTWRGVIAIQCDDASRFSAEMGTEFLSYISDIVCLIVDPWVARG